MPSRSSKTAPLWSPPGEVYNYSNGGYALLGALAETVAGIPYETLSKQRVFDPAGMETATFDNQIAKNGNHAAGHTGSAKNLKVDDNLAEDDDPIVHPVGGIFATVVDYAHLMQTLMSPAQTLLDIMPTATVHLGTFR